MRAWQNTALVSLACIVAASTAGAQDPAQQAQSCGIAFDQPLAIYARFTPPEIAMEAELRAEGFLREAEFGGYTFTIKSAELMSYAGSLPLWHPSAWNRALANRLERSANEHPTKSLSPTP